MTRISKIQFRFVETIPRTIEDGVLYIAPDFATTSHNCACGCGNRVITPLAPRKWKLTFDGEAVSLHPSIGNWSFPCQSHYWIRDGRIDWAPRWSQAQIDRARRSETVADSQTPEPEPVATPSRRQKKPSWWKRAIGKIRPT
jgi:hypothetical protein